MTSTWIILAAVGGFLTAVALDPETCDYVVGAGAWSVGGLVLGYVLGRLHGRVKNLEQKVDRHA